MKLKKHFLLPLMCGSLLFNVSCTEKPVPGSVNLIPQVQSVEFQRGSLPLNSLQTICTSEEWKTVAEQFMQDFKNHAGCVLQWSDNSKSSVRIEKSTEFLGEAYVLKVTADAVILQAGTEQGVARALTTLYQLLLTAENNELPALTIQDQPRFSYRGLMLDCSRHFWTVDELKKTISQMAFFKLNTLHLHLTDNNAWRLAMDKYPELTEKGTFYADYPELSGKFYTKDDLKDTEITGAEKSKLMPTDTGIVVNDFLIEYFPDILDYNFTASVEKQFDEIAEGDKQWTAILKTFYKKFHPSVENTLAAKTAHKAGERILGTDPVSGKQVSVKIGRFGPVAQIGTAEDEEKPRFAQVKKEMSIETITLEEALELFKLPRTLGKYEGKNVVVGAGRFGPYIQNNGLYASLPKTMDPMTVTLEEAIELLQKKQEAEAQKHIKKFEEEPELEILNGRYGPYIAYKGSNYKIPKDIIPQDLNLQACLEIVKLQSDKDTGKSKRTAKAVKATKTTKTTAKATAKTSKTK